MIGALEERDITHLIPVVRTWVRKDDRVIEEEFEAILERFRGSLKRENGDTYLVARDPGGRAAGIMGFAEVALKLASWRSSPDSRARRRFSVSGHTRGRIGQVSSHGPV